MTFDDLKRSLCSVLKTGKIGTPVSMRLHLQLPDDRIDIYSALSSAIKLCQSAINDAPVSLIARQNSAETQLNVLVTFVNGRTILATVGSGCVKCTALVLLLIGNHGVVRLEGESLMDDLLLTNGNELRQWQTAVSRSLTERKQIVISES